MNKKEYDLLIVGAGIYGATAAYKSKQEGKKCLVIDVRPHLGGNIYCENVEGINVHKYGAHIFHTNNKKVWEFVNGIVEFNRYTNSPIANYKGKQYNLPFNMNTFYQMWGVLTPEEARQKIDEQRQEALAKMREDGITEPRNLEEQALLLIGKDIFTPKRVPSPCQLTVRMRLVNPFNQSIYIWIPCMPRILMNHKDSHLCITSIFYSAKLRKNNRKGEKKEKKFC